MPDEIWRAIPGFEGAYEVSDQGRVRSLARTITQLSRGGTPYERHIPACVLRPGPQMRCGHLSVVLGRGNSRCVHELVLLAFVGPRPEKHEARHLNGLESDNRLCNLVWDTRGNNTRDKKWHKGARTYKLRPPAVREIKDFLREGVRGADIARRFGVSESVISHIKHGRLHIDV